MGSGWDKPGGKNDLDLKGFPGLLERCKSALFWQTEPYMGVFSTRTEKADFTGFFGIDSVRKREKGARIGLIFHGVIYPSFLRVIDEKE